ncbi:MAG TPA: hypothetical protein VF796_02855, partial [Humisphaera sp.]
HSTEESGRWICVEARLKLNTPGKADGENQLWVDGTLDAERKNLDLRGTYTAHTINAVFLEAYWNQGSPVDQKRWYDDFVVSTKPIGPVVVRPTPTVVKRPSNGATAWQVEVQSGGDERKLVWQGSESTVKEPTATMALDATTGKFVGELEGKTSFAAGTYFLRCREKAADGTWTDWSPWHQPFAVR